MNARRLPRVAQALLHCIVNAPYRESLEGDLMEEFAAGRSALWYWRQVLCALLHQGSLFVRQQTPTLVAATAFFLLALWLVAPATGPVMNWVRTAEPARTLVLAGWLTGVPFLLGGLAAATERRRRIGAILVAAGLAYLTPVTHPFDSAVCDLCVNRGSTAVPTIALYLTPFCAALLAGLGAWTAGRFRHAAPQEQL